MISAANLGQECLLINQDKNQNTSKIPVMRIEKGINIYTYTYETLINNVT
jgi:hypothetical protein